MTTAVSATGGRRHMILTAALAVAIVAVGGSAAGTLVHGAITAPGPAPAVGAPAPVAAPAPSAPAAPPAAAAVVDTSGRPLPPEARAGAEQIAAALAAGDPAALRPLYAAGGVGAPWAQVATLLGAPQTRDGLLAALRTPPQRRAAVYLFDANGFRLGVTPAGRLQFVQAP